MLLAVAIFATPMAASALTPLTPVGLRAPDGNGRPFDLRSLRGNVVAVTFVSRYTRKEGAAVNRALATRPGLKIVSVVDFMGIPSFVYGYARHRVAEADDGRVRHLCDEHGSLRQHFAVHPDRHVDILIIDRDGRFRGRFEGMAQLSDALRRIDELQ